VLGLIVLPAWMLTVMTSNRRGRLLVDRRLAGWLRADFWAIVRLLDRAAGTYLRGFVVVAFVVGVFTWLGLRAATELGGPDFQGPLALAVFAGAVQVIPELGPLLGFIPSLLLLAYDPERALVYTAVYLGARFLGSGLVGGRLVEGRLGVHRAVLIPGVVVLSQVGPLALLLSAPILAFGSDLVRYLHGRLSEPPRPAGALPGEPTPAAAPAGRSPAPAPVPVVYRGRVAGQSAPTATR
jgi:predicted PurR-regulated permease PerM